MASKQLTISDHVVLRYVERVPGVDTKEVREKIAALVTPAWSVGARRVSIDGITQGATRNGEKHKGRSVKLKADK